MITTNEDGTFPAVLTKCPECKRKAVMRVNNNLHKYKRVCVFCDWNDRLLKPPIEVKIVEVDK